MPKTVKAAKPRLAYLDWARGVASIIMIQGHVFHSFTQPGLRDSSTYQLSQFVGGMPPAIFLFLTGVTFAFLLSYPERRSIASTRSSSLSTRAAVSFTSSPRGR